ncbi:heme exporter protein B [Alphaproteobacteria bacterium]|nr:heme exporter protein B [Alphaproteobacteria bacterium]
MVMNSLIALFRRDLTLAIRQGADVVMVVGFFVLAIVLFPLGVGVDSELLGRIAPGIVWACALFAAMLSLDRQFQADYEDGSLDLMRLSPFALEGAVLVKALVHWVTTGLPLMAISPVIAILFGMESSEIIALLITMALGAPTLSLIGVVGASLVLGARRSGVLLSLLVLPLVLPVLIFGAGSVRLAQMGQDYGPQIMMMAALALAALAIAPIAGASALRQAAE